MPKSVESILLENGYLATAKIPSRGLCGVCPMAYTYGLMVDCTEHGYGYRYCYEKRDDAMRALSTWDGVDDPPGPWIKRKGLGGEDKLGPGAVKIEW